MTTLVIEFVRRAIMLSDDLVAASSNCNDRAVIGDPYLPFRELLNLLAGDTEAQLYGYLAGY